MNEQQESGWDILDWIGVVYLGLAAACGYGVWEFYGVDLEEGPNP